MKRLSYRWITEIVNVLNSRIGKLYIMKL